jgi:hypothetical protein
VAVTIRGEDADLDLEFGDCVLTLFEARITAGLEVIEPEDLEQRVATALRIGVFEREYSGGFRLLLYTGATPGSDVYQVRANGFMFQDRPGE